MGVWQAWLWLCVILSSLGAAVGQNSAGEKGADGEGKGDEEVWEYVEFLKSSINEKLENIFQTTLYEVSVRGGAAGYQRTVKKVLEEVMDIRERILTRIRNIRKGEISANKEKNIKQEV